MRKLSTVCQAASARSSDALRERIRSSGCGRKAQSAASLFEFISAHRDDYDAFVFFGYLYTTSYFGLPLVREKAFLAPLAHDEWPIYLNISGTGFSPFRVG